jgi:hypothetical protein
VLTPAKDKKSNAGHKPTDMMVMFRMLVLQSLYNHSDAQACVRPAYRLGVFCGSARKIAFCPLKKPGAVCA